MDKIVLVNRHEVREIEHEEKAKWIRSVLEYMEIPLNEWWPENPSMENLRKIKPILRKLNIDLVDDAADGVMIYLNDDLIAEWKKPWYKLVEDMKERDIKYRYYYEMHLNCRCVYDENNPEYTEE